MKRCFTNLLCVDVEESAVFYTELLDMTRHYDSDWFVILTHPEMPGLEYGLLQRDHEIVPPEIRAAPAGVMISFVVADCNAVHARALRLNAHVIAPPTDMVYGQRRMLLRDPDGAVLDISAPTAPLR
jgi:predicted enzyme related to lactoylglutathione lyase